MCGIFKIRMNGLDSYENAAEETDRAIQEHASAIFGHMSTLIDADVELSHVQRNTDKIIRRLTSYGETLDRIACLCTGARAGVVQNWWRYNNRNRALRDIASRFESDVLSLELESRLFSEPIDSESYGSLVQSFIRILDQSGYTAGISKALRTYYDKSISNRESSAANGGKHRYDALDGAVLTGREDFEGDAARVHRICKRIMDKLHDFEGVTNIVIFSKQDGDGSYATPPPVKSITGLFVGYCGKVGSYHALSSLNRREVTTTLRAIAAYSFHKSLAAKNLYVARMVSVSDSLRLAHHLGIAIHRNIRSVLEALLRQMHVQRIGEYSAALTSWVEHSRLEDPVPLWDNGEFPGQALSPRVPHNRSLSVFLTRLRKKRVCSRSPSQVIPPRTPYADSNRSVEVLSFLEYLGAKLSPKDDFQTRQTLIGHTFHHVLRETPNNLVAILLPFFCEHCMACTTNSYASFNELSGLLSSLPCTASTAAIESPSTRLRQVASCNVNITPSNFGASLVLDYGILLDDINDSMDHVLGGHTAECSEKPPSLLATGSHPSFIDLIDSLVKVCPPAELVQMYQKITPLVQIAAVSNMTVTMQMTSALKDNSRECRMDTPASRIVTRTQKLIEERLHQYFKDSFANLAAEIDSPTTLPASVLFSVTIRVGMFMASLPCFEAAMEFRTTLIRTIVQTFCHVVFAALQRRHQHIDKAFVRALLDIFRLSLAFPEDMHSPERRLPPDILGTLIKCGESWK